MMVWALAAALAAPPDDAHLYGKLLGEPSAVSAQPARSAGFAYTGLWPLALAAAGAALVVGAKRLPRRGAASAAAVRVAGRASLGGAASVVVVDVDDGAGGTRRLLLSAGGGPTALLADLGGTEDVPAEAVAAEPAPPARAPVVASKAAGLSLVDEVLGARRAGIRT